MDKLRVHIVEDELLIAMGLEDMVVDIMPAVVIIKSSVAEAKQALGETFDYAFLDVDVTDGKTYDIAYLLREKHIPFVFVSGSEQSRLPTLLQAVPFIRKPASQVQIERFLTRPVERPHSSSALRL